MTAREILEKGLASLGVPADEAALRAMLQYAGLLDTGNRIMNLTTITVPEDVARLHFLDSAALLGAADFHSARVADVGTGAGFPGVPLRILVPDMRLTLLDSLAKRVEFLRGACREMGWPVHSEGGPDAAETGSVRERPSGLQNAAGPRTIAGTDGDTLRPVDGRAVPPSVAAEGEIR